MAKNIDSSTLAACANVEVKDGKCCVEIPGYKLCVAVPEGTPDGASLRTCIEPCLSGGVIPIVVGAKAWIEVNDQEFGCISAGNCDNNPCE